MDLVFFHRALRALVIVDLKTEPFTHADAGQMNLYLNYAKEHLVLPGENEPVGLILCSAKDEAVVHYATGGIKAQVFASQYLTRLPDETTLREEIQRTRKAIEERKRSV
jgi:YhcG PDDEXK nuclease domain